MRSPWSVRWLTSLRTRRIRPSRVAVTAGELAASTTPDDWNPARCARLPTAQPRYSAGDVVEPGPRAIDLRIVGTGRLGGKRLGRPRDRVRDRGWARHAEHARD